MQISKEKKKEVLDLCEAGYKKCSSCNSIKILSEFYPNRTENTSIIPYKNTCKECDSIKAKKSYNRVKLRKILRNPHRVELINYLKAIREWKKLYGKLDSEIRYLMSYPPKHNMNI